MHASTAQEGWYCTEKGGYCGEEGRYCTKKGVYCKEEGQCGGDYLQGVQSKSLRPSGAAPVGPGGGGKPIGKRRIARSLPEFNGDGDECLAGGGRGREHKVAEETGCTYK